MSNVGNSIGRNANRRLVLFLFSLVSAGTFAFEVSQIFRAERHSRGDTNVRV